MDFLGGLKFGGKSDAPVVVDGSSGPRLLRARKVEDVVVDVFPVLRSV